MWRYSIVAKAVDERLLVRVTASRSLKLDKLDEHLDDTPCCGHLEGSENIQTVTKQAILGFTAGGAVEYTSALFRCIWCPSELQIAVSNEAAAEKGEKRQESRYCLSISRYIDLGRCESAASREWTSLREATKRARPRLPHPFAMDDVPGTIGGRFEGGIERKGVEAIW